MSTFSAEIVHLLQPTVPVPAPAYVAALRRWEDGTLVRHGRVFREVANAMMASPTALHRRMEHLAREEQCGARLLSSVARHVTDEAVAEEFRAHIADEERHARMLAALAERVVGRGTPVDADATEAVNAFNEAFDGDVRGFLCSIHVAELRARSVLSLYLAASEQVQPSFASLFNGVVRAVLRDEERHIASTGRQLHRWLEEDPKLVGVIEHYLDAYERYWWHDVELITGFLAG